jgi:hypothetical protein
VAISQPEASVRRGRLIVHDLAEGVEYRYTLDGTTPTTRSALYAAPGVKLPRGVGRSIKVRAFPLPGGGGGGSSGGGASSPLTSRPQPVAAGRTASSFAVDRPLVRRPPESASVGAVCRASIHMLGPLRFPGGIAEGGDDDYGGTLPVRWCIDLRAQNGDPAEGAAISAAAERGDFVVARRGGAATVDLTLRLPLHVSHIGFELPLEPVTAPAVPDRFRLTGAAAVDSEASSTAGRRDRRRPHHLRVKKGKFVRGTAGVQWFEVAADRIVAYESLRIEVVPDTPRVDAAVELTAVHIVGFRKEKT